MRKVIAKMNISLDGYVDGPNGEMDWAMASANETVDDFEKYFRSDVDLMFLGRVNWEGLSGYWTQAEGSFADWMNETPKVVFSNSPIKVSWGKWDNATLIHENIAEEVRKLKQQPGKDIANFGGATLIRTFADMDLIDEYNLTVVPVMLGGGKRFFPDNKLHHDLKLLSSKPYPSGAMVNRYEVVRNAD
jgi:dihydrofolate reductase